jgi:hypothetical protein
MNKKIILVDYENIQNISDLGKLSGYDLKILVGNNQTKIPIEVVTSLQKYGEAVTWLQVSGQGKNALDFFIAFFLGKFIEQNKYEEYNVVSKDGGYQPLIDFLNKNGTKAKLVTAVKQLTGNYKEQQASVEVKELIENVRKMPVNTRPKKRKSLIAHFDNAFKKSKTHLQIEELVEEMFILRVISEINGLIKYDDKVKA